MPHVIPQPESIRTVHLMGIGGTAMAAFAGLLRDAGFDISGSDTGVYPPMSTYLERLGVDVMTGYAANNLAHRPDLVIVGNVIRSDYDEAQALLDSDLAYCSFPEAFAAFFLEGADRIVVSGTHGKTTTTSLATWLLACAGRDPGYLIGGVAKNLERTAHAGNGDIFVIEGDEYDTAFFDKGPKFLHYGATTAIITSIEFDHADIYDDVEHIKSSFRKLVAGLAPDATLIVRGDDAHVMDVASQAPCSVVTYGPGQSWDAADVAIDVHTGRASFRLLHDGSCIATVESEMVGEHNLYNQVAAAAAACANGVRPDQLAEGFKTFAGIKRRQELVGSPGDVAVIDDFAHHPTAVKLTLEALRLRFGQRRLWAIWEPRSATSRRNVFQEAYAQAFDSADHVIVCQPHRADEIAAEDRLDPQALVQAIQARGTDATALPTANQIAATVAVRAHPFDVVAILSNGSFDGLHAKVCDLLEVRFGARDADNASLWRAHERS